MLEGNQNPRQKVKIFKANVTTMPNAEKDQSVTSLWNMLLLFKLDVQQRWGFGCGEMIAGINRDLLETPRHTHRNLVV